MARRNIIKIDEEKCDGCGLCVPNCYEGALQIIDGKARLVSDLFCDGLGNCIGHCPRDAIKIIEREAEEYNEKRVMDNIVKQGKNTIKAHLEHLRDHGEDRYLKEAVKFLKEKGIENPLESDLKERLPCSCPGATLREIKRENVKSIENDSALSQWPVQLHLLPPQAPFFNDSHLLVSADCVPFANANFHSQLLAGKSLVIGCPKLDDIEMYEEKLTDIFRLNNIKNITVAIMEVPCCYGLYSIVEEAVKDSGKNILLKKVIVGIDGDIV